MLYALIELEPETGYSFAINLLRGYYPHVALGRGGGNHNTPTFIPCVSLMQVISKTVFPLDLSVIRVFCRA